MALAGDAATTRGDTAAPTAWLTSDRLARGLAAALAAFVLATTTEAYLPTGIPFRRTMWLLFIGIGLGGLAFARGWRSIRPVDLVAVQAIAAMVVTNDGLIVNAASADLALGLTAGAAFLEGAPVYLQGVEPPGAATTLPFVYPPRVLPLFAVLSLLPAGVAVALWTGALAVALLIAFRATGLPWRWALAMLLWPPAFTVLWVGNVAGFLFALYAIAPWFGSALVWFGAIKLYQGVAALWLIRERRWRSLRDGVIAMVAIAAFTLPIVGVARWIE